MRVRALFYNLMLQGREPAEDDWLALGSAVEHTWPGFHDEIMQGQPLRQVEYRMCLLMKVGFLDKEIEFLLGYGQKSLSMVKRRVFRKIYGTGGSARELKQRIKAYGQ